MEYHKIQTVYLRDPGNRYKTLLHGHFARPEFAYLRDNDWIWTEKVDGTNVRVIFNGESFEFRGRTDNASLHPLLMKYLEEKFHSGLASALKQDFPMGILFFGEGYGPKIQSGGKYTSSQSFVVFDAWTSKGWISRDFLSEICEDYELEIVPIVGEGTLHMMVQYVESRPDSAWGDFAAEGVVARPKCDLVDGFGSRIITKLKCKDFG